MPIHRNANADRSLCRLIEIARRKWHPDLDEADVSISMLFADEVKVHGWPCQATVKLNSVKDRVEGKSDCTLTIDEMNWGNMSEEQRLALLDHELTHLALQKDKDGGQKYDNANRPKMRIRHHDYEAGFFWEVVERHKEAAPETPVYEKACQKMRQLCFPWG